MLVNLHVLRFFAAALILINHVADHLWAAGAPRGGWLQGIALVAFGGVDVFFVISGFIMWHTTQDEHGARDAWRFVRRRIARIYSGYWPFLLFSIWLWSTFHPQLLNLINGPVSVFLIPSPLGTTWQLFPSRLSVPVSWTLIYELYFYIIFAFFLAARKRICLAPVLVALVTITLATVYAVFAGIYTPERMLNASLVFTLYLSPFCVEFLLGCLIAEYCRRNTVPWLLGWLGLGVVVMVFAGWANARWFAGELSNGYHNPVRVLLLSGPAAAFVLVAVGLDQRGRQFLRRLCLILGGSSYALYLSHNLWLQFLYDMGIREWLARKALMVTGYWLAAVVVVVLSAGFYQYLERPLHRAFRGVLGIGKRRQNR